MSEQCKEGGGKVEYKNIKVNLKIWKICISRKGKRRMERERERKNKGRLKKREKERKKEDKREENN